MSTIRTNTLAERVLELCHAQPRTRRELEQELGPTAGHTAWNLVAAGRLVNLVDRGTRQAGLYVHPMVADAWRERVAVGWMPPRRQAEPDPATTWPPTPGGDLCAAWGVGARR